MILAKKKDANIKANMKHFFIMLDDTVKFMKFKVETDNAKISVSNDFNGKISIIMEKGEMDEKEVAKELLKQIDKGRKICQKRKVKTG